MYYSYYYHDYFYVAKDGEGVHYFKTDYMSLFIHMGHLNKKQIRNREQEKKIIIYLPLDEKNKRCSDVGATE